MIGSSLFFVSSFQLVVALLNYQSLKALEEFVDAEFDLRLQASECQCC